MTKQITVRLPDVLVQFVDEALSKGEATSRAEVVARALRREQRWAATQREIQVLEDLGGDPYPDLADFHAWAAAHRPPTDPDH